MLQVVGGVHAVVLAAAVAASGGQFRAPMEARAPEADIAPLDETASPVPPILARRPRAEVAFAQTVPSAARSAYRRALGQVRKGHGDEARRSLEDAVGRFPDY